MYAGTIHGYRLIEGEHCHERRCQKGISLKDIKHQLKYHPEVIRYRNKRIAIVDAFQSVVIKVYGRTVCIVTAIDDCLTNPDADIVLSDC